MPRAGSPNFTPEEVERASYSVSPLDLWRDPLYSRIARTLATMEKVRATLGGKPITITSFVRSPSHNIAVGGAVGSHHVTGYGVDFKVSGMAPVDAWRTLQQSLRPLALDELIVYDGHVHISADPRARGKVLDLRDRSIESSLPDAAPADATATAPATPRASNANGCALALMVILAPWGALAGFLLLA